MEDMDWTDKRPLDTLTFGIALPEAERAVAAKAARRLLTELGVTIAEDIKRIGCTTLAATMGAAHGTNGELLGKAIEAGRFLRVALGGSGIGLTCYVPATRFCLIHNTVGGLQDNQAPQHEEMIDRVSRDLTAEERIKIGLVEHVRLNMDEDSDKRRADVLAGRKLPPGFAPDEDDAVGPGAGPVITGGSHDTPPQAHNGGRPTAAWLCPEHDEFAVACRYCLAESIIKGALQPAAILVWGEGTEDEMEQIPLVEVADKVAALDKAGEDVIALYIKAVRWTRRLARE